jgi:hypothetical protein
MAYQFTNERELRRAFWQGWKNRIKPKRNKDGDWPTDIRVEWCDFIEHLARDGIISESLAQRATL